MTGDRNVTVVAPTYNEAGNAGPLIGRLAAAMAAWDHGKGWPGQVDLHLVDDSPDDRTAWAAHAAAERLDPALGLAVTVTRRTLAERRSGLAGALVTGLRQAKHGLVVCADADLQHPPELFLVLADRLATTELDAILPTRYRLGGSCPGLSPARRLVSQGCGLLAHLLFPRLLRGVSDVTGGFFAVRRDRAGADRLRPRSWKVLMELLVRGGPYAFEELGYTFDCRAKGASKASLDQGLAFARHLAGLRLSLFWASIARRRRDCAVAAA